MIAKLHDKDQKELLGRNYVGRLSFTDGDKPYIVPITYFYDKASGSIISYSSEGHKIKTMRKNTQVSLCVDEIVSIDNWRSVLVHGTFEEVSGSEAKMQLHSFYQGVKQLIKENEARHLKFIGDFSSKSESEKIPIVYRIKITESTGKYRNSQ